MKKYKITVLGASGSGKTVFLASMFKSLGIQVVI
jgi:GTPase SAR1 family protein